jgi:hypothetical protein
MLIKHDYSYINEGEKLINKGYAELDIHSLNFDRHYTEEEKENNRKQAESMTREEWSKHCDEISEQIYNQMLPVMNLLNDKYDIHQITEEKSGMDHYRSNWDLYFYSNKGWNGKNHFDHMKISFNDKRLVEQNQNLLEEILALLEQLDIKNVYCRVQYTTRTNDEKIKNKAMEICENLLDKSIEYQGMKGKIKTIDKAKKIYGFFKNKARTHYYNISDTYLILNFTA